MKKKIVIIGATSTIAELCAREWIKQKNTELILVGRNFEKLNVVAQDLLVREPQSHCEVIITDFNDPQSIKKVSDEICIRSTPDIVLIAHGMLPDQKQCELDLLACKEAMEINGISPMLFAEAFITHLEKANKGIIAVMGSVAGDRGRQSNYIYGAAKGLIERYIQGLQHRFHGCGVKIILIKPGPTATRMIASSNHLNMKLAEPTKVAATIVQGIKAKKTIIYAPKKWRIIMLIIRLIPNYIFGKWKI